MIFYKIDPKVKNWATFVRKFVTKSSQELPKLVTLDLPNVCFCNILFVEIKIKLKEAEKDRILDIKSYFEFNIIVQKK